MRGALAIIVSILSASSAPGAAGRQLRLLVASGTMVDGVGLARFQAPLPVGRNAVIFRGTSEGITVPDGASSVRTVIASGAAVPGIGDGTLNSFLESHSTDDGMVAFRADVNASSVDQGIFVIDGGTLRTVVTRRTGSGTLSEIDVDQAGDLAYATEGGVFRRLRASGESTQVAPLGSAGILGSPVIDASGALAWIGNGTGATGGIFHWSDATGTQVVARPADLTPSGTAALTVFQKVAIRAATGVAYLASTSSADGVFLWDPGDRDDQDDRVGGDLVGGTPITHFFHRLGIRVDGSVVMEVRLGTRRRWVVAAGATLTEARSSGLPGDPASIVLTEGIYSAERSTVVPIFRAGDLLANVGIIGSVDQIVSTGGSLAFLVQLGSGPRAIARQRRGRFEVVAVDGNTMPGAGVIGIADGLDVSGDRVAFASGSLVVVAGHGRPRVIRPPDPISAEGAFRPLALHLSGRTVLALGTFDNGRTGIFAARGDRLQPLLVDGDPVPGGTGVLFSGFREAAFSGPRTLFAAGVGDGLGVFLRQGPRIVRLRTDVPVSTDPSGQVSPDQLGFAGRLALLGAGGRLYRSSPARVEVVLEDGEITPLGTLGFSVADGTGASFASTRNGVVFHATLLGGASREALLACRLG